MKAAIVYWGYIRVMDKKMETTILYWGYIGMTDKNMETIVHPFFTLWQFMNSKAS